MSKSKTQIDLTRIFGEQVKELSADQINKICEEIETIVEARTQGELQIKIEIAEAEAKDKYDSTLKESVSVYETVKKEMEKALLERAVVYQNKLVEKMEAFVESYTKNVEGELETFKESLVDKLDKYLELELTESIPQQFVESTAKVAIYEPIVEGFMNLVSQHYVKADTESYGLFKEAHTEIADLRKENSRVNNKLMEVNKQLVESVKMKENYERSNEISKVCEGLTTAQLKRASRLLENVNSSKIASHFEKIKDIVLREDVSKHDKSVIAESVDKNVTKVVRTNTVEVEDKVELTESLTPEQSRIQNYAQEFRKYGWDRK